MLCRCDGVVPIAVEVVAVEVQGGHLLVGDLDARLKQIDHAVEATIKQIENVSGTVKSAVLRPVREVNGIAAGISAMVSTLVRGRRKNSVDSATQDEEMFI